MPSDPNDPPRDRVVGEEALIAEFWAPLAAEFPGAFGLEDDCAVIAPEAGHDLIVTTDAVIAGVHFFPGEGANEIAWKALAVNVSDLIAKGATPFAYVMSIALPEAPEHDWIKAFAEGLRLAQNMFHCHLIGGDTDRTPGPLSVSITAFGSVPAGRMVRRSTARPGDVVYVSGTIGDAALGLDLRRHAALSVRCTLGAGARARLDARFCAPLPPIALAPVVREMATAAMDVSDGLVKDFGRLCRTSGVGGRIEAQRVPLSEETQAALAMGLTTLDRLITGGEDYEVLAAVQPQRAAEFERLAYAAGTRVTCIGTIAPPADGVVAIDATGAPLAIAHTGWDHFQSPDAS
jgi:thiamine-monophosphate kinase